ncbi:MAG: DUF5060 domain-containing protein [Armatimonadota bacterium]|nr:DUF5060 domain-containing protein [Armatimonadota bacterium]
MRNRSNLWIAAVALYAAFTAIIPLTASAAPVVTIVSDNLGSYPNSAVPKYDKYEVTFQIANIGTAFTDYNPFNPNLNSLGSQYYNKKGILVDAVLTSPSNTTMEWPCFYYEGSDGSKNWKLRFAPPAIGKWNYTIRVKYGSDTVNSAARSFNCVSSAIHGFIEINTNDRRFFRHCDGTSFYPIGTDISGYSMGGGAAGTAFPKMKANGANYTRVFFTSMNIEPYDVNKNGSVKSLNNYSMSRASSVDGMFDTARQNDIRIIWTLDDWTYIKDTANQYISVSGRQAPCANVTEFFTLSTAKEIYKRKLRYWLARWGYSTNFLGFDLINETGGSSSSLSWHAEMGDYVHTYTEQPHLVSGDNGSGELQSTSVPNSDPSMDFANYHDYAKYSQSWTIKASSPNLEKMGCALEYPWVDMSVYADRLARLQWKRYKWMKPLSWNEFGLIYRYPGSTSGFPDWDAAYDNDPTARHFRDAMWAGAFAGLSVAHWKLDYMVGGTKYPNGGDKFWIFKPLSTFLAGEEFVGLKQETTYPVYDETNPSPQVICDNGKIMVVAMRGRDRAYFFAKNLTDVWARVVSPWSYPGHTCAALPTPAAQNGTVRIAGLDSGTYTFQRWSTSDTNASTQIKSTSTVNVGLDGVATVSVGIGASDVGFAYKLKKQGGTPPPPDPVTGSPNVSLTLAADKTWALPGGAITYTIIYRNTGDGPASSVVIECPVPTDCEYTSGSATSGGMYDSALRKVRWNLTSVAAGASGTLQLKVTVN